MPCEMRPYNQHVWAHIHIYYVQNDKVPWLSNVSRIVYLARPVDRRPRWPIFDHGKTASRTSPSSRGIGTPIAGEFDTA